MLLGFSDHTIGVGASPYSVLYNAKVIEKHFTLDKSMDGPDHSASLSPIELKQLVIEIKRASKFVGQRTKEPTKSELGNREKMQKCLVATRSIKKDEAFSEENIIGKRTGGTGISALEFDKVVGRFADRSYTKNDIIELSE